MGRTVIDTDSMTIEASEMYGVERLRRVIDVFVDGGMCLQIAVTADSATHVTLGALGAELQTIGKELAEASTGEAAQEALTHG